MTDIFIHKKKTNGRTAAWDKLAAKMCKITGKAFERRHVREKLTDLMDKHKAKNNKDLAKSGVSGPEPSELENLLQNLCDMERDAKLATEESEKKHKDAINKRKAACETIGETDARENKGKKIRKTRSDKKIDKQEFIYDYLNKKENLASTEKEADRKFKEKELSLREKELAIKEKESEKSNTLISTLQEMIASQKQLIDKLLSERK
eukprot:TCONS_00032014-protein